MTKPSKKAVEPSRSAKPPEPPKAGMAAKPAVPAASRPPKLAAAAPKIFQVVRRVANPAARRGGAPRVAEPPSPAPRAGMGLHTADGARKYLTASERAAFLRQAELADRQVRTLCMTLAYAGCRLSEALALTADRVDLAAGVLTIESLKKRRSGIYRAVPVPPALLETLNMVHGIRERQSSRGKGRGERLWPWSRMTGWRAVHVVMAAATLDGPHASPKGLRHGFGVAAVSAGIPLNLVQKWLGHAQLTTTAIYADAVGAEEKDIAQRMWR